MIVDWEEEIALRHRVLALALLVTLALSVYDLVLAPLQAARAQILEDRDAAATRLDTLRQALTSADAMVISTEAKAAQQPNLYYRGGTVDEAASGFKEALQNLSSKAGLSTQSLNLATTEEAPDLTRLTASIAMRGPWSAVQAYWQGVHGMQPQAAVTRFSLMTTQDRLPDDSIQLDIQVDVATYYAAP